MNSSWGNDDDLVNLSKINTLKKTLFSISSVLKDKNTTHSVMKHSEDDTADANL